MKSPKKSKKLPHQPADLKQTIRNLIEQGRINDAKKGLQQYMEQEPDDLENYTLAGVVLILEGNHGEAEKVLLEGLRRDPGNCDLLFNLAYLDEQHREYISALDLYRRAELVAANKNQEQDIREAIQRVMQNIKGMIIFKQDTYSIILEGNRDPIRLDYDLTRLVERRQILSGLLQNMDTRSKTVLEVEFDDWVIAKNLADMGLRVQAFAPADHFILAAFAVGVHEKMRKVGSNYLRYYQAKTDETNAAKLPGSDVVMLLPVDNAWYREKGAASAAKILTALARKAKRQLFFHVPAAPEGEDTFITGLLNAMKDSNLPSAEPTVCWSSPDGSCLYRLDTASSVKTDTTAFIPRGLDAVQSNKAVFEVEVDKCRDLNGMAYSAAAWNHFVALLKQLQANPELAYGDSVLKAYFERFTPANRQEQLFPEAGEKLSPLCDGWTLLPWMDGAGLKINARERPLSRPGGNHHFGPNTDDFGKRELKMIKETFLRIKQFGYQPEIFPDGYIQGHFLKNGSDYRFIVNEGQHRMAAVGVLGYIMIKCKHNPKFSRVVDLKKIRQWPQVKSGLYTKSLAEKVFLHYFESNGSKTAEQLDLL